MGGRFWGGLQVNVRKPSVVVSPGSPERFYFVHSFMAAVTEQNREWVMTSTDYGVEFASSVQKGNILATQFHPEKSGKSGLEVFRKFLYGHLRTSVPCR